MKDKRLIDAVRDWIKKAENIQDEAEVKPLDDELVRIIRTVEASKNSGHFPRLLR